MRKFVVAILAGALAVSVSMAQANSDPETKTVAAVLKEKDQLKDKQVRLTGTVIKVNNGINRRNFIHIQDNSVSGSDNKLILTSQQTAKVGDKITAVGKVSRGVDFGGGYTYDLLVEQATITPAK